MDLAGSSSEPPIDGAIDFLPEALNTMPPALGYEQSIAGFELRLPRTANRVLAITPNFLFQKLLLFTLHHLFPSHGSARTPTDRLLYFREHRVPDTWLIEPYSLPASQLDEQIRVRISMQRSISRRLAEPNAAVVSGVTSLLDSRVGVGVVINLTAVSGLTSYRIRRSNIVHCYA